MPDQKANLFVPLVDEVCYGRFCIKEVSLGHPGLIVDEIAYNICYFQVLGGSLTGKCISDVN